MKGLLSLIVGVAAVGWLGAAPAGDPEVPERYISVDEAKALLDMRKRVVFVDVRSKEQFDELHIRDARSVPLRDLPRRLNEVPRQEFVVLY
jgi:rhodanese-related sulfurtransferase